ncbi:MAG: hypothetical protein K9N23_19060 [Akkermansiaceae bacterium]|nr:hypothetical protein [Akkermansiaceae bacterium]
MKSNFLAMKGFNVLLKNCCDLYKINCDTTAGYNGRVFETTKSTGTLPFMGYGDPYHPATSGQLRGDIGDIEDDGTIPVLLTNGKNGEKIGRGDGYGGMGYKNGGAAIDINRMDPNSPEHADVLGHEMGHVGGYVVEDPSEAAPKEQYGPYHKKDPNPAAPHEDRPLMAPVGGGLVDKCWCEKVAKLSRPMPIIKVK